MKPSIPILLDKLSVVACALWLPACLIMAVVWVRSYWVADSMWANQPNSVQALIVSRGSVRYFRQVVLPTAPFRIMANRGHNAQPAGAGERPAERERHGDRVGPRRLRVRRRVGRVRLAADRA